PAKLHHSSFVQNWSTVVNGRQAFTAWGVVLHSRGSGGIGHSSHESVRASLQSTSTWTIAPPKTDHDAPARANDETATTAVWRADCPPQRPRPRAKRAASERFAGSVVTTPSPPARTRSAAVAATPSFETDGSAQPRAVARTVTPTAAATAKRHTTSL